MSDVERLADADADVGTDLEPDAGEVEPGRGTTDAAGPSLYVESPIIMTTVRIVAPFVFTFGLFVMFHGADSPGGGFQGGVIVGTVILMLGIAFGIETTRGWVGPRAPVALIGVGVLTFVLVGVGSVLLGGAFLEYTVYPVYKASKYGIELVEFAIGVVVSGIVSGLFFVIAAGVRGDDRGGESA
jgi:multicomponent Na+:H+ antiporter subunit B